jgi:hypothetical protein
MRITAFIVATLLPTALASPAAAADLRLLCSGSGTADKTDTITTQRRNAKGEISHSTTQVDDPRPFTGDAEVQITDGTGRIRLPRVFLPDLHGGKDGWFELRGLVVNDRTITAKAALSIFDHPNVRIDRMTGTIEINGNVGDFAARCQPYDPNKKERAF